MTTFEALVINIKFRQWIATVGPTSNQIHLPVITIVMDTSEVFLCIDLTDIPKVHYVQRPLRVYIGATLQENPQRKERKGKERS